MVKINRSTLTTLFLASIISLVACDKTGKQHGTFVANGRLLRDCSDAPLANAPVSISFYEGASNPGMRGFRGVVGSGTTSSDGTFSIECAYYGTDGEIRLTSDSISIGSTAYIAERKFDFGTIYRQLMYNGKLRVSISVPYTSSDTLFIAHNASNSPVTTVHPILAVQTVDFTYLARWSSLSDAGLDRDSLTPATFWGVGRAQFDSAVNSKLAQPKLWFPVVRRCSAPIDITDVIAN